jgi:hypothetical protein
MYTAAYLTTLPFWLRLVAQHFSRFKVTVFIEDSLYVSLAIVPSLFPAGAINRITFPLQFQCSLWAKGHGGWALDSGLLPLPYHLGLSRWSGCPGHNLVPGREYQSYHVARNELYCFEEEHRLIGQMLQ